MGKNNKIKEKKEDKTLDEMQETEQEPQHDKEAIEEEVKEIEKLNLELSEANEKFLRIYSEFENFRKRNARERLDLIQTAGEDIIASILPVIDDFERAIHFNEESADLSAIKKGTVLIHQKLMNILEQRGLKQIEPKGEKFDTELHEAVAKIPAPSKRKKGKIIDVVEKGYRLGDKVIRFPKVVVGE